MNKDFIIGLVVILVLVIIGTLYLFNKFRRVANEFKSVLGTTNILKGVQDIQRQKSEMPVALNGMNEIYLPQIERDFPDFNLDQFIEKANGDLLRTLNAIESQDVASLEDQVSPAFVEKAHNIVSDLISRGAIQHYDDIKIHRTVLSRYRKQPGHCIITLQSAVECFDYVTVDGKISNGSKDLKQQSRYEIDMINVQDLDKIKDAGVNLTDSSFGVHCPNCGAPVEGLGDTRCLYCGSPLHAIQIHSWYFSDFRRS